MYLLNHYWWKVHKELPKEDAVSHNTKKSIICCIVKPKSGAKTITMYCACRYPPFYELCIFISVRLLHVYSTYVLHRYESCAEKLLCMHAKSILNHAAPWHRCTSCTPSEPSSYFLHYCIVCFWRVCTTVLNSVKIGVAWICTLAPWCGFCAFTIALVNQPHYV